MSYLDSETVLTIVKRKLNDVSVTDETINYAIEEVFQVVSSYCNIDNVEEIPIELKFTISNMTIDLIRSEQLSTSSIDDISGNIGIGSIKRVKDGNTEVEFSSGANGTGAHVISIDDITLNYKSQLNKFRRIKW